MKPQPKVCSVNVKQKCLWVGLEDVFFGPHFTFLIGLITLPFLFLSSLLQTKHSIQRNHPCKHVNRLTNWWHTVGKYQNHLQPSCLVNFKLFLTGIAKIFREIWSKKICVQLCGGVVTLPHQYFLSVMWENGFMCNDFRELIYMRIAQSCILKNPFLWYMQMAGFLGGFSITIFHLWKISLLTSLNELHNNINGRNINVMEMNNKRGININGFFENSLCVNFNYTFWLSSWKPSFWKSTCIHFWSLYMLSNFSTWKE